MIRLNSEQIDDIKLLAKNTNLELLFDILKEKYMNAWASTNLDQDEHRQHLYRMLLTVDALKSELHGVALSQAIEAYNRRNINRATQ